MKITRTISVAATLALAMTMRPASGEDVMPHPGFAEYKTLLKGAVRFNDERTASEVDYAWLADRRQDLKGVLEALSGVAQETYNQWPESAQLAFLINAYNAFTLELILTRYPDLESIKDLGSLFRSPWKQEFFTLLGAERSLDEVEHEMIRGTFAEPRIHAAVNCASCGCPALLAEPFAAATLDEQLATAMGGFLADRQRNYYDTASGRVWVSPIFDWYEEDFAAAEGTLENYLVTYSDRLGLPPTTPASDLKVKFTDYDWQLNDLGRCGQ
ncbi:MAG: DUF547 domain-containing protein [Pseudomonadota bacterium]